MKRRVIALEESDSRQWELIAKIQNRPPVWVTLLIGLLTMVVGAAATYSHMAVEIVKTKLTGP